MVIKKCTICKITHLIRMPKLKNKKHNPNFICGKCFKIQQIKFIINSIKSDTSNYSF